MLWLYWSGPGPVFDLGEAYLRRWLYQVVLRQRMQYRPGFLASTRLDLASFSNPEWKII
jgi:hypothetical protein